MRAALIPDEMVPAGAHRTVAGPQSVELMDDVAHCDALVSDVLLAGQVRSMISVRMVLEDGDLEVLQETGHLWVHFVGRIAPFDIEVEQPTTEEAEHG